MFKSYMRSKDNFTFMKEFLNERLLDSINIKWSKVEFPFFL